MCCDILYNFCLKHFSFKKKWKSYDKKCILVFMWNTHYPYLILIKLEFSQQIFKKYSNTKFYQTPPSGN